MCLFVVVVFLLVLYNVEVHIPGGTRVFSCSGR